MRKILQRGIFPEARACEFYRELETVGPIIGPQTHSGPDRTLPWEDRGPAYESFKDGKKGEKTTFSGEIDPKRLRNISSTIQNTIPGQRWTTKEIYQDNFSNDLQKYVAFPLGIISETYEQGTRVVSFHTVNEQTNFLDRRLYFYHVEVKPFFDNREENLRLPKFFAETSLSLKQAGYEDPPGDLQNKLFLNRINVNTPSGEISSFSGFVS